MRRARSLSLRLLAPALVLIAWQFAAGGIVPRLRLIDPALVGRPDLIAVALVRLVASGAIVPHLLTTLEEAVLGLALAVVAGTALGIALGTAKLAADTTLPYMNVLNSIPRLALAPFFVIWFGIGILSKVVMSAATAFFPIFYTTYQGVQGIDRELINALSVMGASRTQLLRIVVLPSVASWVLAGLRTSLGLAIVGAVVSEYLGASQGLGFLLVAAQGVLETNQSWAILVVLALIGVGLDWATRMLERRLLGWRVPLSA